MESSCFKTSFNTHLCFFIAYFCAMSVISSDVKESISIRFCFTNMLSIPSIRHNLCISISSIDLLVPVIITRTLSSFNLINLNSSTTSISFSHNKCPSSIIIIPPYAFVNNSSINLKVNISPAMTSTLSSLVIP